MTHVRAGEFSMKVLTDICVHTTTHNEGYVGLRTTMCGLPWPGLSTDCFTSRPRLTNQYICRFHHPHYCMSCFYRCCLTFRHSSLLSIILNKFLTSMHFIVYNSIITFVEITEKFDGRFTFDCYYLTCVITWIR